MHQTSSRSAMSAFPLSRLESGVMDKYLDKLIADQEWLTAIHIDRLNRLKHFKELLDGILEDDAEVEGARSS